MSEKKSPLGEVIRRRRKRRDLTLGELAYKVECSKTAISKIERGLTDDPGVDTVRRIALALGTTVDSGKTQKYRYYICKRKPCGKNGYRVDQLEADVATLLENWHQDIHTLKKMLEKRLGRHRDAIGAEVQTLEDALRRKRTALARWETDYEDGFIVRGEFYEKRYNLLEQIIQLESRLQELEPEPQPDPDQLIEDFLALGNIPAKWHSPDHIHEIKATLRRLGLHISIKHKEATITL